MANPDPQTQALFDQAWPDMKQATREVMNTAQTTLRQLLSPIRERDGKIHTRKRTLALVYQIEGTLVRDITTDIGLDASLTLYFDFDPRRGMDKPWKTSCSFAAHGRNPPHSAELTRKVRPSLTPEFLHTEGRYSTADEAAQALQKTIAQGARELAKMKKAAENEPMNRNALDHSIAKLSHLAAQKSPPDEAKLRAIAKEFKAALDKAAGNPPPALNGLRFRKVAVTVTSRATEFLGLHGDIPDYLNDNEYEDDLDWGSSNQPPDPKTRALIQTYQAWENNVYRVFNQFKRKYPYEFSMARSIYGSNFTV